MSDPWKPPYADEPASSEPVGPPPEMPAAFGPPREAPAQPRVLPPRLFTPGAIAVATFLGSAMAGALLYAWNLRALGRRRDAGMMVLGGAVLTAVLVGIGAALPDNLSRLMMFANLAAVFGLRAAATNAFRDTLEAAELVSVAPLSGWWCVPVAGACGIALLGGGVAWDASSRTSLTFGPEQTIEYRGEVTEAEAKRVGESLVEAGYFGPTVGARTVDLEGERGLVMMGFYVVEGAWNESSTVDAFACIAGSVHDAALADHAVKFQLLDQSGDAMTTDYAIGRSDPSYARRCGGEP